MTLTGRKKPPCDPEDKGNTSMAGRENSQEDPGILDSIAESSYQAWSDLLNIWS
jgi:hypothetical protein